MPKKSIFLVASLAVLALAVPAMAQATPKPTLVGAVTGKPIPVGTQFVKVGTNVALTSSVLGRISCEKLNLKGVLTKNSDTEGIAGEGSKESNPEQANCTNPNGTVKITSIRITSPVSETDGIAKASFEAVVDVGMRACSFVGTNVVTTYANGSETLTFNEASGINGGACGTAKLDAVFKLKVVTTGEFVKAIF